MAYLFYNDEFDIVSMADTPPNIGVNGMINLSLGGDNYLALSAICAKELAEQLNELVKEYKSELKK